MATHAEDLSGRMLDRVRQMLCGLHGHDSLLQFGRDRICLRCVSCGHETPGWELNEGTSTVAVRNQPAPKPVVRPQLISERRVA
jgi:hypothetical protein